MIRYLRAQLSRLVAAPLALLLLLATGLSPWGLMLAVIGDGPRDSLVRAMAGLMAWAVGGLARGRAASAGGIDLLGVPMPMLPITRLQRLVAEVGIGLGALVVGSLAVELGVHALWASAGYAPTFPFAVHPLAALPALLLPRLLAWLPLVVRGVHRNGVATGPELIVTIGIYTLVVFADADVRLDRALAWAVLGTLLALTEGPVVGSTRGMARPGRPGLVALLSATTWQSSLAIGVGSLVGLLPLAIDPSLSEAVAPGVAFCWMMAAVLPLLPATTRGTRLSPLTPEALFLLPVDRVRATLLVVGFSGLRGLLVAGSGMLLGHVVLGRLPPLMTAVGVSTIVASATMGAVASLGGRTRVMGGLLVCTVCTLVTFFGAGRGWSLQAEIVPQAVMVAMGMAAVLVSTGRVGGTWRQVG